MNQTVMRAIFFQKFSTLTNWAKSVGISFIVTTHYRSQEEQKKKFDEGKSNCDGYTKKSAHQKWLAIDIAIVENGQCIWIRTPEYELLGKMWKDLGGIWGGDWTSLNDIYHFEYGGE